MHYKNGRPALVDELVLVTAAHNGTPFVGVVKSISCASDTCNSNVERVGDGSLFTCVTLRDCIRVDDIAAADYVAPAEQQDTAAAPAAPVADAPAAGTDGFHACQVIRLRGATVTTALGY